MITFEKHIDANLYYYAKNEANGGNRIGGTYDILSKLRMMFARLCRSVKPDLVIMDEFQRFKFLISADVSTETGMADRFLKNDIKILLLSATPYKLYSTLEEISETKAMIIIQNFSSNEFLI